jgi:flagellar biosynthesis/type III secretory pathway protein FliH
LYTNVDIFKQESKAEVSFLPDVNFRLLFNCEGVSEKTKTSIWKYLQLILFTVIGSVNDSKRFGDAANIFEAMDENELHEKMAETMESVSDFFKNMESDEDAAFGEGFGKGEAEAFAEGFGKGEAEAFAEGTPDVSVDELSNVMSDILEGFSKMGYTAGTPSTDANEGSNEGTPSTKGSCDANEGFAGANEGKGKKPGFKLPNPEILKEHLKTLLDGKLGKLAKEFTDEFTNDLKGFFDEEDEANMKSSKDVLAKLIKDPKKMVLILKKITTKLQEKMKRGDISQEELMAEMSGLMEKMKDMGGGADFADMLKGLAGTPFMKMFEKGLGGMGGKIDMNKLNQMTKQSGMKERLRKKMEQKKAQALEQAQANAQTKALAQAETQVQTLAQVPSPEIIPVNNNQYVFKIGNEVQEKSGLKPPSLASASVPSASASPKPLPKPSAPLSEAELIALFSKKRKSGKKTK